VRSPRDGGALRPREARVEEGAGGAGKLYVRRDLRVEAGDAVCEDYYGRIEALLERFRPAIRGYSTSITYDPESNIFTIWAVNMYGESAYLREDMKRTRSFLTNPFTGEVTILEDGEEVGAV